MLAWPTSDEEDDGELDAAALVAAARAGLPLPPAAHIARGTPPVLRQALAALSITVRSVVTLPPMTQATRSAVKRPRLMPSPAEIAARERAVWPVLAPLAAELSVYMAPRGSLRPCTCSDRLSLACPRRARRRALRAAAPALDARALCRRREERAAKALPVAERADSGEEGDEEEEGAQFAQPEGEGEGEAQQNKPPYFPRLPSAIVEKPARRPVGKKRVAQEGSSDEGPRGDPNRNLTRSLRSLLSRGQELDSIHKDVDVVVFVGDWRRNTPQVLYAATSSSGAIERVVDAYTSTVARGSSLTVKVISTAEDVAAHSPVLSESHKALHANNPTAGGMSRGLTNTANVLSSQEVQQPS
ncbi:hypothetical protein T492DRAFT_839669 [Pavlovales sp. CCMP2436]|nr:hypothetical protein T492DRAFT_839669 [Pavlovales sp. CCMP2436]